MLFKDKAKTDFGVDMIEYPAMTALIQKHIPGESLLAGR